MAKSFPINFEGQLWKGGSNAAIDAAAKATGKSLKQQLQRTSPFRSGKLKAGWKVYHTKNGVRVVNPVPYTGFVIRGTRKMKGNEFFAKAMSQAVIDFKANLAEQLGKKFAARVTTGISQSFSFDRLSGSNGSPLNRSDT